MTTAATAILEMLGDDIVSHGWVAQCAKEATSQVRVEDVLRELLESAKVEIGNANPIPGYVEFIGWRGDVEQRIQRASNAVDDATDQAREFAYWLCLREYVDRFEDVHH